MPRQYSSNVTLYVTIQGQAESSDAAYQASQLAKERVVSYAPLLTDERITEPVIQQLQLNLGPPSWLRGSRSASSRRRSSCRRP